MLEELIILQISNPSAHGNLYKKIKEE